MSGFVLFFFPLPHEICLCTTFAQCFFPWFCLICVPHVSCYSDIAILTAIAGDESGGLPPDSNAPEIVKSQVALAPEWDC